MLQQVCQSASAGVLSDPGISGAAAGAAAGVATGAASKGQNEATAPTVRHKTLEPETAFQEVTRIGSFRQRPDASHPY